MVVARVVNGIWTHFRLRLHEWVSAVVMLGMGVVFLEPINTFEMSSSYIFMAKIADESVWGTGLTLLGGLRFLALVLNGTFKPFKTASPVVRSITATLSAITWAFIACSILFANDALPGWLLYFGFSVLDAVTGYSVAGEAGAAFRAQKDEFTRS